MRYVLLALVLLALLALLPRNQQPAPASSSQDVAAPVDSEFKPPRLQTPAADDAAGMSGPDVACVPDPDDVETWPPEPTPEEKQAAIDVLSRSDLAEHQLAAIIMGRWPGMKPFSSHDKLLALDQFVARNPQDSIAFFSLLNTCRDFLHEAACADQRLHAGIRRLHDDNSEAWALLASYRASLNQEDAALEALGRAATATVSDSGIAAKLDLLERAYAAGGGFSIVQRLMLAWGDIAAEQGHWLPIYRTCKSRAESDLNWRRLCLDYARRAERQVKTVGAEVGALALQRTLAEFSGDDDEIAAIEIRLDDVRQVIDVSSSKLLTEEAINQAYLEAFAVGGERAALAVLADEVARRGPAKPCPEPE
ncbi:MAG: hypothetical protein KJO55_03445 [Gammaproteobacteria bacterium]|nr:hypothetical protein [Gammaproteobacteria bacterium]